MIRASCFRHSLDDRHIFTRVMIRLISCLPLGDIVEDHLLSFISAVATDACLPIGFGLPKLLTLINRPERVVRQIDTILEDVFVDVAAIDVGGVGEAQLRLEVHDLTLQRLQLTLHYGRALLG